LRQSANEHDATTDSSIAQRWLFSCDQAASAQLSGHGAAGTNSTKRGTNFDVSFFEQYIISFSV
jgi:hypothetical protein